MTRLDQCQAQEDAVSAAAKRCAYWWERRSKGKRYVNARGQCKRNALAGKSYCSAHKIYERSV